MIVGIDPGFDGYACALGSWGQGNKWVFHPAPVIGKRGEKRQLDIPGVVGLCLSWRDRDARLAVIERQQVFAREVRGRRQGLVSSGQIMFGYGVWLAALAAAGIPVEEVLPVRWKASLGCLVAGGDGSSGARSEALSRIVTRAKALFPQIDLRPVERGNAERLRVPSPDKAAALLLAEYGRRILAKDIARSDMSDVV